MKPVRQILLTLAILAGSHPAIAQFPKPPGSGNFPGMPARHFILLQRKQPVHLFKIQEGQRLKTITRTDTGVIKLSGRVERIRTDSVWLGREFIRFSQVREAELGYKDYYLSKDSLNWIVNYPPENVYSDRFEMKRYLDGIHRQMKRDKADRKNARSFMNQTKVNITKFANLEIAYSYERKIVDPVTIEIEIGYQFATNDSLSDDFFNGAYPLYKYKGLNVVAGPKYYLGKIPYVQFVAIYRYLVMDKCRSQYASPMEGDYALQSQFRNDLGGGVRFGLLTRMGKNGVLDAYIGGGVKVSWINQFVYGYYPYHDSLNGFIFINSDHSPANYQTTTLKPVFNAGVKIGFGF